MADDRPRAVGPELGSLLSYAFLVFLLFFAANILVDALPSESLGGPDRVRILADKISSATSEAWRFGRPILQLIVILVLLQWILRRLGLSLQLQSIPLTWDIRALLAILVVAAFSLAALSGGPGMGALEDVCLVVVGFYFGGLTKTKETTTLPGANQP